MKRIKKLINSKEDFERLENMLIIRIKHNNPVSDNGMMDGLIIGYLSSHGCIYDSLFVEKDKQLYRNGATDGLIQQMKHIYIWICTNESKLCELMANLA